MFATITISLIAILFAWSARFQKSKFGGLELAFMLLAVFMSIRYNFGNDYAAYLNEFLEIGRVSNINIILEQSEFGWILLNKIFQPIGFFGMVIVLTVFEYIIIYRLIKKYVPRDWYWLSVFIFTFNTAYMLVFASMMRQFFAMCIFILAVEFILQKRLFISILLVLLASLFHVSALILLPFCFFGYVNITLTNSKAIMWFGVYLIFHFFAVKLLSSYFFKIIEFEQFQSYEGYVGREKDGVDTGFGVIFSMLMYVFLLFHQRYQSRNIKLIFLLFAVSFFFNVFEDIAPLTVRLGYYFSVFSIICYPLLFNVIRKDFLKYLLLISYIIVVLKSFIDFFDPSGIWFQHFYTYQTIFSAFLWL